MAKAAGRIAIIMALIYGAALAILYFAQGSLIYPAPHERHAPAPGFAAVPLTTADGLTLTAHWRAPQSGRPSVVFFHGNGGSLAGSTMETTDFAARGYGVLLVEYRGYGGNPGTPSEAGFYKDGRAAMAFLAKQGVAPPRAIVIGHSIGSGTATQIAREFAPAALILTAPFTSLADVAAEQYALVPVRLLLRDRFDNLAKISLLELPVLVIHGTADDLVPFAHGQQLAQAASRPTFMPFEGAGHELSFEGKVQARQLAWLAAQGL